MKFNWKILVAVLVIVAISYWAITSLLVHSYSGTAALNFGVGTGPVTVTNSSDAPVVVQLAGTGARTFNVTSDTEGLTGTSTRTGTGNSATQLYEITLPPGETVFTVLRGTNVTFVAPEGSPLAATVQPGTASETQTTLIVTAIVILGSLFFISMTTGHQWINMLRGIKPPAQPVVPSAESAGGGQGRTIKSYGDNSP
jgi:hypothetical protein